MRGTGKKEMLIEAALPRDSQIVVRSSKKKIVVESNAEMNQNSISAIDREEAH